MTRNYHPGIGRAVLRCRCGRMLDLLQLCRPRPLVATSGDGVTVTPICCATCVQALEALSTIPAEVFEADLDDLDEELAS